VRGGALKLLTILDEYTRECHVLWAERAMKAQMCCTGCKKPWSDTERRSICGATTVRSSSPRWCSAGSKRIRSRPSTLSLDPWQNGFVESFHGRFRDECLNREELWTLTESRVVVGDYRQKYNQVRPHSRLGYESPAIFAARSCPSPAPSGYASLRWGWTKNKQKHNLNPVPGLTHGLTRKVNPVRPSGSLDLRVLTVQRTVAGSWWNFERVLSPFCRLWLILDGRATVQTPRAHFELRRGCLHLVPAFTLHDCRCSRRFDHFHLHFLSRVPTGLICFRLLDCEWQVSLPPVFPKLLRRLEAIYPNRRLPCFDPARTEYPRLPAALEQMERDTLPAEWLEAQGILRLLLAPFLTSARLHEASAHAHVTQRIWPCRNSFTSTCTRPSP